MDIEEAMEYLKSIVEEGLKEIRTSAGYGNPDKYQEAIETLINRYEELKSEIRHIRNKLEIADYYFGNDALKDLNKLLGESEEE